MSGIKVLTPVKAIRAKCLDCCGGQNIEVRLCQIERCPLFPYRMGHRPKVLEDGTLDPNNSRGNSANSENR